MNILITGGCGFLGSNLASSAIQRGEIVYVFDNLAREGASQNLLWLREQGEINFIHGDIRNQNDVIQAIKESKPDVIFHLAGQVAMTTSIINPRLDFETNVVGTFQLLEAVRLFANEATVVYSSTNKVYGDLDNFRYGETLSRYECLDHPFGFDESISIDFHSPYGCSKGAADQYMLDYARIFGLKTVVFRHSSMYGGRQYATYDQGWIGWFCQKAVELQQGNVSEAFTINGNGKQVRDVLHADDMITLYFSAVEYIEQAKGQAFNIGGGISNSLSLLELFSLLEDIVGVSLKYNNLPPRDEDQRVFVADLSKAKRLLQWEPKVDKLTGIKKMVSWVKSTQSNLIGNER